MPFISIKIIKNEAFVPLIQFSAGQDQNVLCAEIVQLSASVSVGDINDHTFEWEQLLGTPVLLEDDNTLSPWFVNPNTTDIVFRLWIDRDTPFEKFQDVNIFRELAGILSNLAGGASQQHLNTPLTIGPVASEARELQSVTVQPTSYFDQDGTLMNRHITCSDGPFMISWLRPAEPSNTNEYLGVDIQRWDRIASEWIFEAFQPDARRYYNIENNNTYRLATVWRNKLTNTIFKETTNLPYKAPIRPNFKFNAGTSVLANFGTSSVTSPSQITKVIISLFEADDDTATNLTSMGATTGPSTISKSPPVFPFSLEADISVLSNVAGVSSGTKFQNTYILRASGITIGQPT